MEITLETVSKNKELYNGNIDKIKQQRAILMKQVKDLRKRRETMTYELDIAELDFEESKLIQKITDLTNSFKNNKLTLEQLEAQEDVLSQRISKETYSDRMVANRKAKQDLSKQAEIEYDENEIKKCEKAIKLYTLMGDTKSVDMWKKSLEQAQQDLKLAQEDLEKDKKSQQPNKDSQEQETQTPYINEYGEIIRPDNTEKRDDVEAEHLAGYTRTEENGVITEEMNQVLKDYSGKQIGNRTSTEKYIAGGARTIETTGEIENDDGKYTISEYSRGDENGEIHKKQMTKDNKITGEKEEFSYQKDSKSETYLRKSNGQMTFKITKTDKGISIDEYRNGQPYATYEYDENGKAVIGMEGVEEIDEDYIANFFDSQVPYFEAEGLDKEAQAKSVEEGNVLKSAIEATEETTRTSTINEQAQTIRTTQKSRDNTRQSDKQEYKESPETKTRTTDNPESFRDSLKFEVTPEMYQAILDGQQDFETDLARGNVGKVEKNKTEDTEYGVR